MVSDGGPEDRKDLEDRVAVAANFPSCEEARGTIRPTFSAYPPDITTMVPPYE